MELMPKKRFGQHFLRDSGVLDRILRVVQPAATDLFLEVGAGPGALTIRLAESQARIYAVELDRDIIPALQQATASCRFVTVVAGDVLSLDFARLLSDESAGRKLRAVGNLPYNVATAVIDKCLNSSLRFQDMTFMTQLEVAERIVASPGSRVYGCLSVLCQHLAEVRVAFKVSPGSFVPPPKVRSALVVFRPNDNRLDPRREQFFVEVVRAAFGHRRKTLANSLRQAPTVRAHAETILSRTRIDGSRRPEELTVQEYEAMAQVYSELH